MQIQIDPTPQTKSNRVHSSTKSNLKKNSGILYIL